jgi:antitoxin (DNA-binding transcriptional repressor) of toxin-antitoxin stability system
MKSVTTYEAKTQLSRLLAEVEKGREIAIRRGKREIARLVPAPAVAGLRPPVGTLTSGPVRVEDGAFEPLGEDELAAWGL